MARIARRLASQPLAGRTRGFVHLLLALLAAILCPQAAENLRLAEVVAMLLEGRPGRADAAPPKRCFWGALG